jgi:hypothetical protein
MVPYLIYQCVLLNLLSKTVRVACLRGGGGVYIDGFVLLKKILLKIKFYKSTDADARYIFRPNICTVLQNIHLSTAELFVSY